jgi:hypothetical protein
MSVVSKIYRIYSGKRLKMLDENRVDPWRFQQEWFEKIIAAGSETIFGKEHNIKTGTTIEQFQNNVPLRDYDKSESWINRSRMRTCCGPAQLTGLPNRVAPAHPKASLFP